MRGQHSDALAQQEKDKLLNLEKLCHDPRLLPSRNTVPRVIRDPKLTHGLVYTMNIEENNKIMDGS